MLRVIFRTIQLNAVPKRKRSVDLLLKASLSNMREDGRIARSDMANEYVVESERFGMMLGMLAGGGYGLTPLTCCIGRWFGSGA